LFPAPNVGPQPQPPIRPRDQVHPLPTPPPAGHVREAGAPSREGLQAPPPCARAPPPGAVPMAPGAPGPLVFGRRLKSGVESPAGPATTPAALQGFQPRPSSSPPCPRYSARPRRPRADHPAHGAGSRPARLAIALRKGPSWAFRRIQLAVRGENRPATSASQQRSVLFRAQLAALGPEFRGSLDLLDVSVRPNRFAAGNLLPRLLPAKQATGPGLEPKQGQALGLPDPATSGPPENQGNC